MRAIQLGLLAATCLAAGCATDGMGSQYGRYDWNRPDPAYGGYYADRYYRDDARYRERRLSQKLTAAEVRALQPLLARTGMTVADIDHLRPWAAALMLSMQPAERRGARVDAGADMTVARDAHGQAKAVRAFESLEDQVRIFADLPERSEVAYLADVIHERSPRLRAPRLRAPRQGSRGC